jgi:hypothetical protein
MNALRRSDLGQKLLEGQPVIIQHNLIGMKTPAARGENHDMLRNGIHELSEFALFFRVYLQPLGSLVRRTVVPRTHDESSKTPAILLEL